MAGVGGSGSAAASTAAGSGIQATTGCETGSGTGGICVASGVAATGIAVART
jgi:hypothetical protein